MSGWEVKKIKTIIKTIKPCFTFLVIALITAVILLVPTVAFAEDDPCDNSATDGGNLAETTSETAITVKNRLETNVSDSMPTEAPISDNNSAEVNGNDSDADTDSNNGDKYPETAENEAFTDAGDLDQSNSDVSNNKPTSQETTPLPETSPAESTPDSESDETNSVDPDQVDLSGAGQEGNSYIAEVTSERVLATSSEDINITVKFTEAGHVTPLGSVQLTLPDGFSNLNLVDESIIVTTSDGSSKTWTGGVVGLILTLMAQDENSYLGYGESVSANLTANTPAETGIYTLTTKAWTDNAAQDLTNADGHITNKNNMAAGYSDPTVGVFTINSLVEINDAAGLTHLSTLTNEADLAKDYILNTNISFSGFVEWIPIGSANNPFTGTFDGNSYFIDSIVINKPDEDYIGMFAFNKGTIYDLTLTNVDILGRFFVGGLTGRNKGTINNVVVSGVVEGESAVGGIAGGSGPEVEYHPDGTRSWGYSSDEFFGLISNSQSSVHVIGSSTVGGLIGGTYGDIQDSSASGSVSMRAERYPHNFDNFELWDHEVYSIYYGGFGGLVGSLNGYGLIEDSHATGNVEGKHSVGGLVGNIQGSGWMLSLPETSIAKSYATGNVSSYFDDNWFDGNNSVGGLVGKNWGGFIRDSYATGSVSGDITLGGLVGYNDGIILNSYATGLVTSDSDRVGGLVGFNADTIINSYYDTQTTGQNDTGKGIGRTTAEMKTGIPSLFIYNGWGNTVWSYSNDNYPQFGVDDPLTGPQLPQTHIFSSGNGSAGNPYHVETLADLIAVNYYSEAHFIQISSIDLAGGDWQPIGNKLEPFTGVYDGANFTISNLTINEPNLNYGGLFGYTGGTAEIKNLNLTGVNINGNNYIGGLVGFLHGEWRGWSVFEHGNLIEDYDVAVISNIHTSGNISGKDYIGGLIGYATGVTVGTTNGHETISLSSISNSSSSATVEGYQYVGGLIGLSGGLVDSSNATGNVTGKSSLYTYEGLDFEWCEQSYALGGLIGEAYGIVNNSYATGEVYGYSAIGGLIGSASNSITNSYSTGKVTGYSNVGGLIGLLWETTSIISDSYALGNVNGTTAANICQRTDNSVGNLYGSGHHSGSGSVGGLVGRSEGQIIDGYAHGIVTGRTGVGGLVGVNLGAITNCHAIGRVQGGWGVGGLVGINWLGIVTNSNATGRVTGNRFVGQLIGFNYGFDNITGPSVDVGFMDFVIPVMPPSGTTPQAFINQTMPSLQALISNGFVTSGTMADLIAAKQAFGLALQQYQEHKGSLSPVELASAETGLAITWAAIQALEASLKARAGEQADLTLLVEAYNKALAVLEEHRALLSPEQIAYATAILAEISLLINMLSPMTT